MIETNTRMGPLDHKQIIESSVSNYITPPFTDTGTRQPICVWLVPPFIIQGALAHSVHVPLLIHPLDVSIFQPNDRGFVSRIEHPLRVIRDHKRVSQVRYQHDPIGVVAQTRVYNRPLQVASALDSANATYIVRDDGLTSGFRHRQRKRWPLVKGT